MGTEDKGALPGTEGVQKSLDSFADGVKGAMNKIVDAFTANVDPKKISDMVMDVDDAASNIAKYFGQGREQIDNIRVGLADSIVKINKLGGDFNNIVAIQEGVAKALGRNVVVAASEYEKLFASAEVAGTTANDIVDSFKNVGISTYQASKQIETVINKAREIGVSATAVSTQVLGNLDMMNKYTFKNGVDGLAKMAAQAVNLRISVSNISNTLDKAFNPESAIEMAASLQRLGVAQSDLLDPLRLMDLAQNDPAELQNQIAEMSKQFVQLNEKGQFEIMPGAKRQLMEIESALGMSNGTLSKMALSSAELGDKMTKIRFPDTFTEEQKTMIANMAEMGEGGEYKMMINEKELGIEDAMQEIMSMSKDDQEKFFSAQKPKEIVDLAGEQLSVSKSIDGTLKSIQNRLPSAIAGSKVSGQFLDLAKKDSKKFADSFDDEFTSVKVIREKLNTTTDGLSQSFKDGKVDFDKLRETMVQFKGFVQETIMGKYKQLEGTVSGVFNNSDALTGSNLAQPKVSTEPNRSGSTPTVQGKDVLKMPGKNVEFLPQDTFIAMTKGPEFLEKLKSISKSGENKTTSYNENKNTHDINLTIKIDGGNVSEDKIIAVLNRTDTLQALNKKLKETINSNGLMV
jgi:hypothetical protein